MARTLEDEIVVLTLSNLCAVLIGTFHLQSDAEDPEAARATLKRGDTARAWETLQHLQGEVRGEDGHMTLLRMHHILWQTARALGHTAQALQHLETYLQIERRRALVQLRARSELLVPRAEAEMVRVEAERHRERAQSPEADAHHDPLTLLGNRRELVRRWHELVQVGSHDWSSLGQGLTVTLSAGLASAPPYELETLVEGADKALYEAKKAGRNRVCGP